jgi:hypothetical protein
MEDVMNWNLEKVPANLQVIEICLKKAQTGHDDWKVKHVGLLVKDAIKLAKEGDRIVYWNDEVNNPEDRMFGNENCFQTDAAAGKHDSDLWLSRSDNYCNVWFRKEEEYVDGYIPSYEREKVA